MPSGLPTPWAKILENYEAFYDFDVLFYVFSFGK